MYTIEQAGNFEQTLQKSRFIAWASQTTSEQHALEFLRVIATQHVSAHHLAFAYRVKTLKAIVPRFSDAGEPSGTAGKPILQMLEGRELINVCVGVIRYYGGVNLGTGGLARAYSGTAKLALKAALIMPFIEMQEFALNVAYSRVDELIKLVLQLKGRVLNKVFTDEAQLTISLPIVHVDNIKKRFHQKSLLIMH